MGSYINILKCFHFIIHIFVSLVGLGLVVVSWKMIDLAGLGGSSSVGNSVIGSMYIRGITTALIGVLLFVLGVFGCCTAIVKGLALRLHDVVPLYMILMFFPIIVCGTSIASVDVYKKGAIEQLKMRINSVFQEDLIKNSSTRQAAVSLQETYQCCGAHNYNDWHITKNAFPENCCRKSPSLKTRCLYVDHSHPSRYYEGCQDAVQKDVWLVVFYSPITYIVTLSLILTGWLTSIVFLDRVFKRGNRNATRSDSIRLDESTKHSSTPTVLELFFMINKTTSTEPEQALHPPSASIYPSLSSLSEEEECTCCSDTVPQLEVRHAYTSMYPSLDENLKNHVKNDQYYF